VDWFFKPSFLRYYEYNSVYYLGTFESGMYISSDGINWNDIPYFDTITCNDIAFYEEHIVLSEGTNQFDNIHYSNNSGTSWFSQTNGSYITKMEFDGYGNLFGVKPYAASSSGVYKSIDHGITWDAMNWEFNITSLACDAVGNVLVGWENGYGVAMLDPNVIYPDFVYLNDGLPDTHVNNIKINPTMSSITIFVCTISGVYYSYDYYVDINDPINKNEVEIFPNPIHINEPLKIKTPENQTASALMIFNSDGRFIRKFSLEPGMNELSISELPPGMYVCTLNIGTGKWSEKLLVID
jgi:hypothetical protein